MWDRRACHTQEGFPFAQESGKRLTLGSSTYPYGQNEASQEGCSGHSPAPGACYFQPLLAGVLVDQLLWDMTSPVSPPQWDPRHQQRCRHRPKTYSKMRDLAPPHHSQFRVRSAGGTVSKRALRLCSGKALVPRGSQWCPPALLPLPDSSNLRPLTSNRQCRAALCGSILWCAISPH